MLATESIRELPAPRPRLHAFRITGMVTREDMAAMGARMAEVFETSDDKVDMLLMFDRYEGAEAWPASPGPRSGRARRRCGRWTATWWRAPPRRRQG